MINGLSDTEILSNCISETNLVQYPLYRGKVRDVYTLSDNILAIIATDRISAFDHILGYPIPYKGQILSVLANYFFQNIKDLVPIHTIATPHPNITIAKKCQPVPIEVVMRAYLTGHAWRTYNSGLRTLCGVTLPESLKEHDKLPEPILTPATKAVEGHDEDISEEEIISKGIVSESVWRQIRKYAFQLFRRGSKMAADRGLILVDTKYEFGLYQGEITLIDEVHTADSSRYFYAKDYEKSRKSGNSPKQLSKEFVREWLMKQGFQGLENQTMPELTDSFRIEVFHRYKELYENLTGQIFTPVVTSGLETELPELLSPFVD